MADNQKDRYIQYLAEQHQEYLLTQEAMQLVLEDFLKAQQQMQEEMASLRSGQEKQQSQLDEETRKRKAQRLDECLKYANANLFGDKNK